ncbi:uncharacterized protein LOC123037086 [Drosophila rhopaloa]|uniref:Integrase catalytic domain-containing protein n=1 Tax=Drosophila rhopaloa TaxID=1041015 RepID=A0ABM5J0Z1_DRORH|nr:uncharacterized protein LOC123037086 [Drosophila rhopaloa]
MFGIFTIPIFMLVHEVRRFLFIGFSKVRRGCPQVLHCDSGTNFVGASCHFRALRERIEDEADAIREFASKSGCEFVFTPLRAPLMGELWEAGVKTAKSLLLRAVGNALLSAEELGTVLVGIEAEMYSRPLGAISNDPSDGEALTTGHLLTGGPLIATPAFRTPDQEVSAGNPGVKST